jgi:putative transposase
LRLKRLLDDRDQCLLRALAGLQERREIAALPQFRDAQLQRTEAGVEGVPGRIGGATRRVDDLVQSMGLSGISKSQSPSCAKISTQVHAFLDRPLAGERPYLGLDATYLKQREGGPRRKRSVRSACRWAAIGAMIGGWRSKQIKCPLTA